MARLFDNVTAKKSLWNERVRRGEGQSRIQTTLFIFENEAARRRPAYIYQCVSSSRPEEERVREERKREREIPESESEIPWRSWMGIASLLMCIRPRLGWRVRIRFFLLPRHAARARGSSQLPHKIIPLAFLYDDAHRVIFLKCLYECQRAELLSKIYSFFCSATRSIILNNA